MKMIAHNIAETKCPAPFRERPHERGSALTLSLLIMAMLAVITMSVLAVVRTESRIAGSDLCRTQTFYASQSKIEQMTNDFNALYAHTSKPTQTDLDQIRDYVPQGLIDEGFSFSSANQNQMLQKDDNALAAMQASQNLTNPRVVVPTGPFAGLTASVIPYKLQATATSGTCAAEVKLQREINNYLIPLFQFGMFSNEDIELHPGPAFTFNGRVHANGNIYVSGNVKFLARVTTANEFVTDLLRNGQVKSDSSVSMQVGAIDVPITDGSVNNGPNLSGAASGQRGYFPDAPNGTINTSWDSTSIAAAQVGVANQFGGQLLTRSTGGAPLLLPLQLDGNPTREIIKRQMQNDDSTLSESRYHTKAQIRILIDDEISSALDDSGVVGSSVKNPTKHPNQGLPLSTFVPTPLPNKTIANGGGRALWHIKDDGSYDGSFATIKQGTPSGSQADTVRGVQAVPLVSTNLVTIPAGAGIRGRILIEIVPPNGGAPIDVTQQILSMGVTEGEPNGIVYLQRPLWASFTQGSRDTSDGKSNLLYLLNTMNIGATGEIGSSPTQDPTYRFLTNIPAGSQPNARGDAPASAGNWNSIVPINVYNVREGRINTTLDANTVWERGITSVVEINMRNLARWVDGVYDANLLAGTNAVSSKIDGSDGYILYVSDRRGDGVRSEKDKTNATLSTTNGMDDNEDIYGPNNSLDPGEDVIDAGINVANGQSKKDTLQKILKTENLLLELPDPAALAGTSGADDASRIARAKTVAAWPNSSNYFRRAVRLFNGEDLQVTGASGKLSTTKGITVATENMVYIWGNYNTTGITCQPTDASTLNDPTQVCHYLGNQVPTSIVSDAFTPLSKTWFDSESALYPDDMNKRMSDLNLPATGDETSVRTGIIAGNNLSALSGSPNAGNASNEYRLCGGMHNFPRFMENWRSQRWNFVGTLIPLYHSTQALGPYNADSTIYSPPTRNWAFDETFRDPTRLPPGTPAFQYIEPTGFRQIL